MDKFAITYNSCKRVLDSVLLQLTLASIAYNLADSRILDHKDHKLCNRFGFNSNRRFLFVNKVIDFLFMLSNFCAVTYNTVLFE